MCSNEPAILDFNLPYNTSNETIFSGMFKNRPSKIAAISISAFLLLANIVIWYGAIWFEHFGSDHKRTLVNKMFTSLCWTAIAGFLISSTDIVRYTVGPFPWQVCYIQIYIKNILKTQCLLFYDSMALTRYIFIFWLKNPIAVDDGFWSLFVSCWIILSSMIINFVHGFLPGPQPLPYYTCGDLDPTSDLQLPKKKEGYILFASVVLLVFINLRIFFRKNKKVCATIRCFNKVTPISNLGESEKQVLIFLIFEQYSRILKSLCGLDLVFILLVFVETYNSTLVVLIL